MILDEPTSALDARTESAVIEASGATVWKHGKPGQAVQGIFAIEAAGGYVKIEAGSGFYEFRINES